MIIDEDSTFFENNPTKGKPYAPTTPAGVIALHLRTYLQQADWLDELADAMSWTSEHFDSDDVNHVRSFSSDYRSAYRKMDQLYDELIKWHGMEDLTEDAQIIEEARQRAQITLDQHRRRFGLPTWDYPEGKPRRR